MKMKLGYGIFAWDGTERRSRRYGSVIVDTKPFEGPDRVEVQMDTAAITQLVGKRVRLTVEVVATRTSTHFGDAFLHIVPTTPEMGEVIELGVGTLLTIPLTWLEHPAFCLAPDDGRKEFWIDPRKLYRLHDQTVNIFAEETSDDFSEAPVLEAAPPGIIGNGDGSFQMSGVEAKAVRISPTIKKLEEGMFLVEPHVPKKGQRIQFEIGEPDFSQGPNRNWDRFF